MDHGLDAKGSEHMVEDGWVAAVALYERTPLNGPTMAAPKIIQDQRLESRCHEHLTGVTADVPSATGHKNVHQRLFPSEDSVFNDIDAALPPA
jgi:hypothetical protein